MNPGSWRKTETLCVADASQAMLSHLKRRFASETKLRYYHTDGLSLPPFDPGTFDYVIAFDVFVHFDPRLVYWYVRQIARLLRPGGTGIIHYANVTTTVGWEVFEFDLADNVQQRQGFSSFGVMCL